MGFPWFVLILPIVLQLQAVSAQSYDISAGSRVINCTYITGDNQRYLIYMWENNQNVSENSKYQLFIINETTASPSVSFLDTNAKFQYNLEAVDSKYEFYSTQTFDYENNQKLFMLLIDTDIVEINVLNYDDEQPTLTSPMCSLKELFDYDIHNTTCNATLTDTDGWVGQTTFKIINSRDDTTNELEQEDKLFNFYIDTSLDSPENYTTTVYITTLRQLDYDTKIFYSFSVQAKDGAGHSTLPNENVTCIINVEDVNNKPPEFTDYFTAKQIVEKTEYDNFSIKAVDGDKGRNRDILYFLEPVDSKEEEDPYISINKATGQLLIKPIDRDADDLITYQFRVRAQKVDDPPYNNSITVTLYLEDLDDNSPLVMSLVNNTKNIVDYTNKDDKSFHFWFYENFAGTLDATITITDIDTGNNALFDVALEEYPTSAAAYTDAFFIVPTAGYRTAEFQISVKNATYLDYENSTWDNFQFYVHSSGRYNLSLEDRLLVEISLIDYNDETPKFDKTSYEISVNETIKKGEQIIQVKATDRDAEDKILKHVFVGAESITSKMDIDSAEGIITVAVDDAFDYDKINPVIFQVQAIDKADPPHTATVPVTVKLLDVNNKAPTYTSDIMIEVNEKRIIGTKLNTSITASDVDTTNNLTAVIDWDNSYVTKNSIKKDGSDPDIYNAMRFLNLTYHHKEDSTINGTIEIELYVNDVNENQTAPLYKTFDTLYLNITITDWNTLLPDFVDKMNTTALIAISIIDIRDNPPAFTEETLALNRTIQEEQKPGVLVGYIEAKDPDEGDVVTYSCVVLNETYNWFDTSTTGSITVKTGATIDCDSYNISYVDINCTATDGTHYVYQNFSIYILDKNNKYPAIDVNKTYASEVSVLEKSEGGTNVTEIDYHDADRDIPYHTATCDLDDYGTNCYAAFEVTDNTVRVKQGAQLNRDEGIKIYECSLTCKDNPKNFEDEGRLSNTTTFSIKLEDINDHAPVLITTDISAYENLKADALVGKVQGMDIDEGDNAEIDFNILSITKDGEEVSTPPFDIVKDDEDYYVPDNDTLKQWHLMTLIDLKDLYGTYAVHLNLSDKGTPQNYTDNAILTVVINKYNYYQPEFVYPSGDDPVYLSLDQEDKKQLILYSDNKYLDDFQITNVDKTCSEKWDPTFDVQQISPSSSSFFYVLKTDRCVAQLQVQNYDRSKAKSETSFMLNVITTLANVSELQPDEKSYTSSVSLSVIFVDLDQEPIFENIDQPCILYFLQDRLDTENTTAPLDRKAKYPKIDVSPSIYYFISTSDDTITDTFDVDIDTGSVKLKQKLYYNTQNNYTFKILASKNKTTISTNEQSYLTVEVKVVDSNIHVPQWTQSNFVGPIMRSTQQGSTVVTVEATDEDKIDQGKLKYTINSTIEAVGSDSIKRPTVPFYLGESTGDVSLNFTVDYNMYGYFVFTVKVEDPADDFGNPSHENTTKVTIYIVTDDNTANFRFENTLEDVTANLVKILASISTWLNWDCHDQNVRHDTNNGQELTNVTVAAIYCVEDDTLQTSTDILKKVGNINTFQNLRKELLTFGILLQSFTSESTTSDNLEQILKLALIIVTVILGTLCVILAITFFLKIRGLNRRLKKLTEPKFGSDESNLNRKAINAPTTNLFAVEGSNPVFNNEVIKEDLMYDKHSIHSGDSDLIGVEDDPEFDMFGERQDRF